MEGTLEHILSRTFHSLFLLILIYYYHVFLSLSIFSVFYQSLIDLFSPFFLGLIQSSNS